MQGRGGQGTSLEGGAGRTSQGTQQTASPVDRTVPPGPPCRGGHCPRPGCRRSCGPVPPCRTNMARGGLRGPLLSTTVGAEVWGVLRVSPVPNTEAAATCPTRKQSGQCGSGPSPGGGGHSDGWDQPGPALLDPGATFPQEPAELRLVLGRVRGGVREGGHNGWQCLVTGPLALLAMPGVGQWVLGLSQGTSPGVGEQGQQPGLGLVPVGAKPRTPLPTQPCRLHPGSGDPPLLARVPKPQEATCTQAHSCSPLTPGHLLPATTAR